MFLKPYSKGCGPLFNRTRRHKASFLQLHLLVASPSLPMQQLRTKDVNKETWNHYFICSMLSSGQHWLFLQKSFLKCSLMQSVLRLNVLLYHVSQILGHILFEMSLTAWKSSSSFIILCQSLVAATWITRITWLLQWLKRFTSFKVTFKMP